jgi:predicted ATPase/class 3 adenylate cyclase/DNA-binding winged helix-turn-helix (wHTH) protein
VGLVVGVLGPLEVLWQGRPVPINDAKERAVLALLAVRSGRPVPVDRLIEDLWGGDPPSSAIVSLQVVVGRLRQALAEAGQVIVAGPSGYRLGEEVNVDLVRFEELVSEGRTELAQGGFERAAALLREGLARFRGPALAGVSGDGARAEAIRLEDARVDALVARIEADLGCGRHAQMLDELQTLTEELPYREDLWAARMRALYRSGRRSDALQAFQELRRRLATELGLEPSSDLHWLDDLMMAEDPSLEWAGSDGAEPPAGPSEPARSGVATFLFTDLVESTAAWSEDAGRMSQVLLRHNALLKEGIESHAGLVAKHTGDGVVAIFSSPVDAVRAAIATQVAIDSEDWGSVQIGVRMGIHSGEAEFIEGDVYGLTVNIAARLEGAAHGGQILISGVTEQMVQGSLPEDVWLISHGERLFKGVRTPIKVFQVGHPDLPQEFPEIRCRRPGTTMPKPSTPFLDPRNYAAQVQSVLGEHRLVTLTGPGGVGKSRLAVEACHLISPILPDGVRWVNLMPVDQPEYLAHAVASDLQVSPGGGDIMDVLIDHLQHQRVLVVLDNCERHVDAVRSLAADLLHECSELSLLTTSREPLRLADEFVIEVEPLLAPHDPSLVEVAVELFALSAIAVGFSVGYDAATRRQIREICERIDGLPLAIELAAGQLSTLSLHELQRHLEGRVRVLAAPGRRRFGEPEHHRAISATVQWSYDLLAPDLQLLLERLAVFRGGFTADAVAQVCYPAPADVFDTWQQLSDLARKSLLRTDPNRPVTRFSLLETVRSFAGERLEDRGDFEPSARRHARYYTELAEAADRGRGGPDEAPWVATEQEELANFRAAVAWAADAGEIDLVLRTYVALYELAAFQGRVEIFDWIDPRDYAPTDHELVAAALAMSGIRHGPSSPASLETAERAALMRQQFGLKNHRLLPWARGFAEASRGNAGAAVMAYQEAAAVVRDAEGENGRWITALSLDPNRNRDEAEELLIRARRIGQPTGLASAILAVARLAAADEPATALRLLERAADLAESVSNLRQLTQNDLAAASVVGRADPQAALGYLTAALTHAADLRQNETVWRCVASILAVLRRAGHEDAAAELATIWTEAYPEGAARYPVFEAARREGSAVLSIEPPGGETGVFDRTFELLRDLRQAGV